MLMKYSQFWIGSGLAALLAAVPAFALTDLPMDRPTTVAGIVFSNVLANPYVDLAKNDIVTRRDTAAA